MNSPTSVRGADRALMIFEAFEVLKRQLTLREIAGHCDLPVSSCHALVQTLLQRGYLYTLGKRKELYPNSRILGLAQTIVANDPFLARFSTELEALRDESGETVTIAKRQENLLQYIYTLESPHPIRYAGNPGEFRPLHSTASGKALLSGLSKEQLEEWLKGNPLKAVTSKTITSRQRFLKDLDAGRSLGYFVASGEQTEEADVIAVPVVLHSDAIAVAIAGPSYRVRPAIRKIASQLLVLKQKLEAALVPAADIRKSGRRSNSSAGQKAAVRAA